MLVVVSAETWLYSFKLTATELDCAASGEVQEC